MVTVDHWDLWVIYDNPLDFPGQHVARRHVVRVDGFPEATDDHHVADTLDAIRALLPEGLTRIPRFADDEPQIVETWL